MSSRRNRRCPRGVSWIAGRIPRSWSRRIVRGALSASSAASAVVTVAALTAYYREMERSARPNRDDELADLSDDELAQAFIAQFGVSEKRALELVEIHRGRAKRDLRQTSPKSIDDFTRSS